MIIAIDGTAASGKGTLARRLARHFGLAHLDTGSLYRRVGLALLSAGRDPGDPEAAAEAARTVDLEAAEDAALRTDEVGQAASRVASVPAVRAALVDMQRRFARQPGGAVLDGRDIGTVICPDADVKLYLDAAPEVRARRRCAELAGRGAPEPFERVLTGMRIRDARDSGRDTAPMRAAADAAVLRTDDLDADAVLAAALRMIEASRA